MPARIQTGRRPTGRVTDKKAYCHTCGVRLTYGTPTSEGKWQQLSLTREQMELLLLAAAEFDSVGGATAVEFTDWIRPDVIGTKAPVPGPEFSGVSRREGGNRTGNLKTRHGAADPIAYSGPLPEPIRRKVA